MGRLRPSIAKVWLACPKTIKMGESIPEIENPFTTRGTQQHLLGAYLTREKFGIPQIPMDIVCEDPNDALIYSNYCKNLADEVFTNQAFNVAIEEKIDLSDILLDGNGIADFIAYNDNKVLIIDYKAGYQKIFAIDNPQLYLYGLGVLNFLKKHNIFPKDVYVAICQPSRNNFSYNNISAEDLWAWKESINEKIDIAYYDKGGYVAGEHCGHCKARGACKAYLLYKLNGGTEDESETD